MGNCLVTKLKESVQNDNLEKLNEAAFIVAPNLSNYELRYANLSGMTMSWDGDVTILLTGNPITSPYVIPAGTQYSAFRVSSGENGGNLYLNSKYDMKNNVTDANGGWLGASVKLKNDSSLKGLSYWWKGDITATATVNNPTLSGNISALKQFSTYAVMGILQIVNQSNIYGEVDDLLNLNNISSINIQGTKIKGDIDALGALINLSLLNVTPMLIDGFPQESYIGGTVEGFVAARLAAVPNTAGSISLYAANSNVTYLNDQQQRVKLNRNCTLNWTAEGVISFS